MRADRPRAPLVSLPPHRGDVVAGRVYVLRRGGGRDETGDETVTQNLRNQLASVIGYIPPMNDGSALVLANQIATDKHYELRIMPGSPVQVSYWTRPVRDVQDRIAVAEGPTLIAALWALALEVLG